MPLKIKCKLSFRGSDCFGAEESLSAYFLIFGAALSPRFTVNARRERRGCRIFFYTEHPAREEITDRNRPVGRQNRGPENPHPGTPQGCATLKFKITQRLRHSSITPVRALSLHPLTQTIVA